MTLEKYVSTLDIWADEARQEAALARDNGDERNHSIHLMRASMMGDMLKTLGRVELSGRKGTLEKIAAQCDAEAEKLKLKEDFDAAERSLIKAQTIRRVLSLINKGDD